MSDHFKMALVIRTSVLVTDFTDVMKYLLFNIHRLTMYWLKNNALWGYPEGIGFGLVQFFNCALLRLNNEAVSVDPLKLAAGRFSISPIF